jgi:Zn-dependent M28 family amino/carboxypeptidase
VPALYLKAGVDYVGRPPDYGPAKVREYLLHHYHRVSDEVQPDWDLSGAVEDTRLLFLVAWEVAQAQTWPAWKPGSEFKARREAQLHALGSH